MRIRPVMKKSLRLRPLNRRTDGHELLKRCENEPEKGKGKEENKIERLIDE